MKLEAAIRHAVVVGSGEEWTYEHKPMLRFGDLLVGSGSSELVFLDCPFDENEPVRPGEGVLEPTRGCGE